MSTFTVPLTSGGAPAPVQVTGNAPAGFALINTDAAATITVKAGATGPTIAALEPGGSLVWRDPAVYPYAYATGGTAAPVVLVVTDQATDYSNPAAVAAVTAAQLAAQGLPSTMLDTGFGAYQINAGSSAVPLLVGECSTLVVGVSWPQPTPLGASVVRLRFDDPAIPDLPAIDFFCTNNNAVEPGFNTWQVPVVAPRLTITNIQPPDNNNAQANVQVVGNNRPAVGGFRQLGSRNGTKTIYGDAAGAGTFTGRAYAGDTLITQFGVDPGTGPMTRFNGPVTLNLIIGVTTAGSPGAGILSPAWVDETGRIMAIRLYFAPTGSANDVTLQWNHPSVPVYWRYFSYAAVAGNYFRVTVSGAG